MGDKYFQSDIDLQAAVQQCMMNAQNKLILTGHSTGASAAIIGAIRFKMYDSHVIGFGTYPIIDPKESCNVLDSVEILNFVNT